LISILTMADVVDALQRRLAAIPAPDYWPVLPIVGRTTRYDIGHFERFLGHIRIDEVENALYFWGRVPIDVLIQYLATSIRSTPRRNTLIWEARCGKSGAALAI
jgi:hypothetical protein